MYTSLLSSWLAVEEEEEGSTTGTSSATSLANDVAKDSLASYSTWAPAFRSRLVKVATRLQLLKQQTAAAKWEGSLRGAWPCADYDRLVVVQSRMINNLVQVSP